MNAQNSRWYLRVAPDEVLARPVQPEGAVSPRPGAHRSGSVRWRRKCRRTSSWTWRARWHPSSARRTRPARSPFHLPDFIQIVFNAGDDRQPVGRGRRGEPPNWAKVETQGRGRTVAMTNIGTDPDGRAVRPQARRVALRRDVGGGEPGLFQGTKPTSSGRSCTRRRTKPRPDVLRTSPWQEGLTRSSEAALAYEIARRAEGRDRRDVLPRSDWMGKKMMSPGSGQQAYAAWLAWYASATSPSVCAMEPTIRTTRSSRRSRWGSCSTRGRPPWPRPRRRRGRQGRTRSLQHPGSTSSPPPSRS